MKNLIFILFLFIFALNSFGQWYPSATGNVGTPNNIEWQKNTQKIISGSTVNPSSVATLGGAGSILMKTDGDIFVKKDAGLTTNWKKFLDEATNLLSYIPTASSTQNGILTSTDWSTFNGKENVLSFSSPLGRIGNVVSIPVATTATSGYLSSTDWTTFNNKAPDISASTKDFSGFVNPASVNVSYDIATDRITLTGDTSALWRGQAITSLPSGWVSPAHPAGNGTWFLYYDGATATTTWSSSPWTFDKVQIALAFDQTYAHFGLVESHGLMGQLTHKELHETVGAYLGSGGDFSSYVLASTTAANRRPDISSTLVNDEDKPTTLAALTSKAYTQFSLTGTASTASIALAQTDIVQVVTTRPNYNQFTGGSWQQTPMTANAYQAVFIIAVPVSSDVDSQAYRYMFVQGQQESTTLSTIQALSPSSVNLNGFVGAAPEFVFIGKIILRYVGGGTNNWSLISVEKLTGTKVSQAVTTGNWLSSVTTSAQFTGDGTVSNALTLATSITDGLWTASGTDVYRASGRVGIGTTNPTSALDVVGNIKASGEIFASSSLRFLSASSSYIYTAGYSYKLFLDGSSLLLNSGSSGNVGIGTTTPGTKLHVVGDSTVTGYTYIGAPTVDGSFRMYASGGALITEKRISGVWTEVSRLDEN